MALDSQAIVDAINSHTAATGAFDRVQAHEPKNAPGNGLTAAVWVQEIGPVPLGSGLAATTGRVAFNQRLYSNMLKEPQDAIDPNLMTALDLLIAAYSGDFTLGGLVRNVDLLGAHGEGLTAKAGFLSQDNRLYRVMDLTIPTLINDLWTQEA